MARDAREDSVALVEDAYFGGVARGDLDGILALFTADARMRVYHGDGPADVFAASPGPGERPLAEYFAGVLANYTVSYADFEHTVDVAAGRHACTFSVTLAPRACASRASAGPVTLANCNFFGLREGRIHSVTIYYVNPAA